MEPDGAGGVSGPGSDPAIGDSIPWRFFPSVLFFRNGRGKGGRNAGVAVRGMPELRCVFLRRGIGSCVGCGRVRISAAGFPSSGLAGHAVVKACGSVHVGQAESHRDTTAGAASRLFEQLRQPSNLPPPGPALTRGRSHARASSGLVMVASGAAPQMQHRTSGKRLTQGLPSMGILCGAPVALGEDSPFVPS